MQRGLRACSEAQAHAAGCGGVHARPATAEKQPDDLVSAELARRAEHDVVVGRRIDALVAQQAGYDRCVAVLRCGP